MLISILSISIIILLTLITLFLIILLNIKVLLNWIKDIAKECRSFIEESKGFFTILFIVVFLFEQIIYIVVVNTFFNIPKWLNVSMGIFALIVVTTASFQKFVWEYKFQSAQQRVILVTQQNKIYLSKFKELIDELDDMDKELERLEKKR